MIVTVVVNGTAQLIDPLSATLETRIATRIGQWYQVLEVNIQRQYDLWPSFFYDFQATIVADTGRWPSDAASVAARVRNDVYEATGYVPSAVSVTSSGQPTPAPPEPGAIDSVVKIPKAIADLSAGVSRALGVTLGTAQVLVVVLGIGAAMLIIWIARNPQSAARAVR